MGTSVSGLSSGFDWASMIDKLIAVEHGRVDLIEDEKTEYENKLSEWQNVNSLLLDLQTSVGKLMDPEDFSLFSTEMTSDSTTVDAEDLLSVSAGTNAAAGTYTIEVINLATAQKLSSNPFTSKTTELGSSYAGDILINGRVISISETDTLVDLAAAINNANTGNDPSGVTAGIISYGESDYRLLLTSDSTGNDGISLLNGSSADLVQKLGWKDNQTEAIKNSITQGAQSDLFTSSSSAIQSLLSLSTGEASSGALTIDGTAVSIDLSADSLTAVKDAINTAMSGAGKNDRIVASVISEIEDGTTYYRLQIEGTETFTDENNILNTLGVLDNSSNAVSGVESGNPFTANGSYISADTLLTDIDGYISYTGTDNIQMTGSRTGGGAVNYTFNISSSSTVQDLLDAVEAQYGTASGDAIAYITSDGKIRVDDAADGGSLDVILTDNITNGQLEFTDGNAAFTAGTDRQRELIEGTDAIVKIDGVQLTSEDNSIEDIIEGVTLKLKNEDSETTVTLNIDHDTSTIKSNIQAFVASFNSIASYINSQFSYDTESEETGGILFGDGTLSSIKTSLLSILNQSVWGVNDDFSSLSLIGIETDLDDNNLQLSLDASILDNYLNTNFNDVKSLFIGQGTIDGSNLTYVSHSRDTEDGAYDIHVYRAATRATETGSMDLSAGGADETLTITEGSKSASIAITGDMTLTDIRNAINTELDTEYAESIVGDEQLYADNIQSNVITASTTWDSIYNDAGTSAGLSDENIISFSGTNRNGNAVDGSYTISDASSDTVQGLLSAIEDAFANKITATIDTSGRIVVTDRYTGDSSLSLSFTEPAQLDFGSVDVSAGAGDGSREGRYALAVTATDDGSDHLVLRSDDYGVSSFTISQDTSDSNYDHILYTDTSNTTVSGNGYVYITEDTQWNDIYGANLAVNDSIDISGFARNGSTAINGSYTISSLSDTVSGLLTEIETAYSNQGTSVNAFIRDGKIYVEDTTPGSSLIELTLEPSYDGGGSGLSLGAYEETTERDLDLGLINGTFSGQNIAGTIGGESATGTGQTLKGDENNINTEDLSISYTGTSNNTRVGTIKVTIGIAELFERTIFNMTDTIDGYIAYKQNSLESNITRMDDKIEEMEARLDLKTELLMNKYIAMELALSTLQNQSSWLTGQISAIPKWSS